MWDCNYAFSGLNPCRGNYSYFHKQCPEHLPNYYFLQKKGGPEEGPEGGPDGVQMGAQKGFQMGVQMGVQMGSIGVQKGGGSTFCTDLFLKFAQCISQRSCISSQYRKRFRNNKLCATKDLLQKERTDIAGDAWT